MVDDIYIYNWITLTVEITNRTDTWVDDLRWFFVGVKLYRLHGRDTGKIHLQPFSGKKKTPCWSPNLIGLIFKIKYHQQTLDFEYPSFFQFKIHLKPWSNIQNQISLQVSSCHIQDRESFHWSTEAHGSAKIHLQMWWRKYFKMCWLKRGRLPSLSSACSNSLNSLN